MRDFPSVVSTYDRAIACFPGQELRFPDKLENIARSLAAVDGVVIAPGETFSFWRVVGRPTEAAGYRRAAALKSGVLTEDIGGSICLSSTLLYNVALLAGAAIIERRCHSVDSYGDARYFELGRDAAVEHPYIDLRFRNALSRDALLHAVVVDRRAHAELRTRDATPIDVQIEVSAPHQTPEGFRFHTSRTVTLAGAAARDDLGWSDYRVTARDTAPRAT